MYQSALTLGNFILSISSIRLHGSPHNGTWRAVADFEHVALFETTSFLNGSLSSLVAGRILYHRYQLRKTFGKRYGGAYTRIMVIIIQPSLLNLVWDGLPTVLARFFWETAAIHKIEDVSLIIAKLLLHINVSS